MYLPDNEIKSLIDNDVLYNAKLENVQQVSYDLTIAEFHDKGMRCDTVDVKPGNSIFVSTEEKICLPKNLVAQVSLRNSWIRKGLLLDSPVYFPGHNTHIYFRITISPEKQSSSRKLMDLLRFISCRLKVMFRMII